MRKILTIDCWNTLIKPSGDKEKIIYLISRRLNIPFRELWETTESIKERLKDNHHLVSNYMFWHHVKTERFVYALFVDDVLITGAHERRIQELIARENPTIEHDFCYYALLTEGCCEPQFEDLINNTAFSKLPMVFPTSIGARLVDGDFLPNTRVMKRILSLEKNLLEELLKGTIITELSYWNLLLLVEHAELNNYHTHDTYKENYNIILNKLEHVRFTEK